MPLLSLRTSLRVRDSVGRRPGSGPGNRAETSWPRGGWGAGLRGGESGEGGPKARPPVAAGGVGLARSGSLLRRVSLAEGL